MRIPDLRKKINLYSIILDPTLKLESYAAETSTLVKDHVVCLFDGQSIESRELQEQIELHLMANGLYSGILDDQDQGDKKTIVARSLACYAVISINLSDSCRDVIQRLKTKDPKACWDAP